MERFETPILTFIGIVMMAFCVLAVAFAGSAHADDGVLIWQSAAGAAGYKIEMSADSGQTWGEPVDVGNATTYTWTNIPSGLVLFRTSAYDANYTTTRTWSGAWFNDQWKPVESPGGTGIE